VTTDTMAPAGPASSAVTAMLEARSVALVGASARPGSLGARMIDQLARSPSRPRTYLVNPRYADIGGLPCLPDLAQVPEPVDLVLLAVPDAALADQLTLAARTKARSAVIFGNAFDADGTTGLRNRLAAIAIEAGMALCGAACMGFVNVARGLRAVGYIEPDPVPAGPVALITHSGSVFSTMLRARRGFGFSLAVSSGQELVTTAAAYARYALHLAETKILALVLEAIRDPAELRAALDIAVREDVPVVLLSAGLSQDGKALVQAHSGALAGADGAWEALARAYGLHRVHDLAELADTLELFAAGRRCDRNTKGIATVHDSGLERAHVADLAAELEVPFASISPDTTQRLAKAIDPGLKPGNPLDVWGTGRDTEPLFAECLSVLAADPAVAAVALAVDLVPEFDGDEAYPRAMLTVAAGTGKPVAVLAGLPGAVDPAAAAWLRGVGIPVLEGTRSGLLALRHLLDHAERQRPEPPPPGQPSPGQPSPGRQRWAPVLAGGPPGSAVLFDLLRDYGIAAVRAIPAGTRAAALAAAAEIGYPVVLKTEGVAHKSDVGGVRLGLAGPDAAGAAYDDLAARLGPDVLVCETAAPGTELALGLVRDAALGPLLVISAGGVLIEIFSERAVVLPPVTRASALGVISSLRLAAVLAGARGQPPADLGAIADAVTGLSRLAGDLGDLLDALDINPLICGPSGAVAADVLAVIRLAGRELAHHGAAERRQRVPDRAPLAPRLDQVRVAQHLRVLRRRGRADPHHIGQLDRALRLGQRAQHGGPGGTEQAGQVVLRRVGQLAVGLRRVQQGVPEPDPVADAEHRRPGPERRRDQQQPRSSQVVFCVVTIPFQPVLTPPQPPVEVLEQRLVAAGGEHRHAPGDVAVKRADHAVPAGRDDRVVEGDQRPHQHLQGLGVTVGQVLQPGRGPAGTVPPQAGQFGAQVPARGGAHHVECFVQVGGGRLGEDRPRPARGGQVEQWARGGRERPPRLVQPRAGPPGAPQFRQGQPRLHQGRRGRAEAGARQVVGGEVDPYHDCLNFPSA
jgi:acetate---CoA ligase (ADP-forming)